MTAAAEAVGGGSIWKGSSALETRGKEEVYGGDARRSMRASSRGRPTVGADSPCRVALADDNDALRVLLGTMIDLESGLELVGEAGDGVDAVELAERQRPDVLVLDFAMPRMDGLEVLGRLALSCPDVRVIVYTGHSTAEVKATALELGAVDCLDKGGSPDHLIERLRRTCA